MAAPNWVHELIGIPFVEKGRTPAGCDCWGVVRLALARGFGVSVPDYAEDYPTTTDRDEIAALMRGEALGWTDCPLAEAQPGDVVLFRIQGMVCHAGLAIEPPWFLHAVRGIGSALERWDAAIWSRRLSSVLRHPEMMRMPGSRSMPDLSAGDPSMDHSEDERASRALCSVGR